MPFFSAYPTWAAAALATVLLAACGAPAAVTSGTAVPASAPVSTAAPTVAPTSTPLPTPPPTAAPTATPLLTATATPAATTTAARAPTAAPETRADMPFAIARSLTVADDGTIYVAAIDTVAGQERPFLWGFSSAGDLVAYEGDQAGYTSPLASVGALAATHGGEILALDPQAKMVALMSPRATREDGSFPLRSWSAPTETGSELTDVAALPDGDLLLLDGARRRVVRVAADGTPRGAWALPQPPTPEPLGPSAIVASGDAVFVAVGATIERLSFDGVLQGSWQLPGAANCPQADPSDAHTGIGGLALHNGTLYVADRGCTPAHTGAQVALFDTQGTPLGAWPIASPRYPDDLAVDPQGRVYVLAQVIHGGSPSSLLLLDAQGAELASWSNGG